MQAISVPPPQRDDPSAAAEDKMKGNSAFRAGLFEVRITTSHDSIYVLYQQLSLHQTRLSAHSPLVRSV